MSVGKIAGTREIEGKRFVIERDRTMPKASRCATCVTPARIASINKKRSNQTKDRHTKQRPPRSDHPIRSFCLNLSQTPCVTPMLGVHAPHYYSPFPHQPPSPSTCLPFKRNNDRGRPSPPKPFT